ncbi:histidine kinase dimerization/phosphoacceptor domain -containing protein [Desulfobacterales bacterium HSG2]|nr:histidine kinase dimerization/phosphoacceptor domain -containing protein [Desulfobacterales bacterium HSG2]
MEKLSKETPLIFATEKSDGAHIKKTAGEWKVMIADDDPEVHQMTQLVLSDFSFSDKTIQFISACSGKEAKELMRRHPDIALILLDVVMEEDDSGLEVVRYVREELENHLVRIILRTGQPGQVPERKVIVDYDINDYKSKTELTSEKLFTAVLTSLRAYQGLTDLKKTENYLDNIINSMPSVLVGINADERITHWNFKAEKSTGITAEKAKGEQLEKMFPQLTGQMEKVRQTMMSRRPQKTENIKAQAGGEIRYSDIMFYPLANDVEGAVLRMDDVTDRVRLEIRRKRAESELKQANEQIRAALREKEVLLREIHHRVKNNMQVISGLLDLQSMHTTDEETLKILKENKNRIRSMAIVHEKLYRSEDISEIDFKTYITDMINTLFRSYQISAGRIELKRDIEDVSVGIDIAIPLGLILNELISNALKYAFPKEREGKIRISLRSTDKDEIELIVSDNGIGISEDLNLSNVSSLGLKLVRGFAEHQLGGKVKLIRGEGTEFIIRFKNA